MLKRVLVTVIAASAIAALPGSALSASFLKLTDITGESTNDRHRGEIDILTFTLSVVRDGTTRAMAQCGPVTLMKNIDRSSPVLLKRLVGARHIAEGVLTFETDGDRPLEYYTITMQEVMVTELTQIDSTDPARIVEKLMLTAKRYLFEYRPQDGSGNLGPAVKFSWDCITHEIN